MAPWSKMYRKSFLDEHELRFIDYTMEDLHFNVLAYDKADKIVMIEDMGYNNVVNMASTTHTLHKGIRKDVDILVVFDSIATSVAPNDYVRFFYKKSYLYYLLFSGRHSDAQTFLEEYKRISTWLTERGLSSTLSAFNPLFRSEPLTTKCVMFIFDALVRLKLLPLFAKVYCRPEV